MRFRLTYRGKLKGGNSADRAHKHDIRRHFHRQLRELWNQPPLSDPIYLAGLARPVGHPDLGFIQNAGGVAFASLVTEPTHMLCELDILFLRPSKPGSVIGEGGDLDNRIKTLIDALRVPTANELPEGWQPDANETPLHCLLSDDKLVNALTVRTDRLLEDVSGVPHPELEASLVIAVKVHATRGDLLTYELVM